MIDEYLTGGFLWQGSCITFALDGQCKPILLLLLRKRRGYCSCRWLPPFYFLFERGGKTNVNHRQTSERKASNSHFWFVWQLLALRLSFVFLIFPVRYKWDLSERHKRRADSSARSSSDDVSFSLEFWSDFGTPSVPSAGHWSHGMWTQR